MKDKPVQIFTDGSCLGNPGPGGWGVILRSGDTERELSGSEAETTNNRMELRAAIEGLASLSQPATVEIYTDSIYVCDGMTRWIHGWKKNGWKTAGKKPVKNDDLWRQLDTLVAGYRVEWRWVKGHAGHPDNERADKLARKAAEDVAKMHG